MTERELISAFHSFEGRENAFVQFPNFWPYCRFFLYQFVAKEIGLFDQESNLAPLSLRQKIKAIGLRPTAAQCPENLQVLSFAHSRKIFDEGQYLCPYTYFIDQTGFQSAIIESFGGTARFQKDTPPRTYFLHWLQSKARLRTYFHKSIDRVPSAILAWLAEEFKMGHEERLQSGLLEMVSRSLVLETYIFDFLKKKKPQSIALTTAYNNIPLVRAAKKAKVPVIELQHGSLSTSHIGYSYGSNGAKAYLPDFFFSFGEKWHQQLNWPVAKEAHIPIGYAYFEESVARIPPKSNLHRAKKKILVIDQKTISHRLISFINELANLIDFSRFEIQLRKHPHNSLEVFQALDPRIIRNSKENNLYSDITEADFVLGSYSTVLYEAFGMKKAVGVLPLWESNYMQPLLEMGVATQLQTPGECLTWIAEGSHVKLASQEIEPIFKSQAKNNFEKALNLILIPIPLNNSKSNIGTPNL